MGLLKVFVVALSAISAVGAIPMPKDDNAEKDSPYITDAPKSYSGDYTKFPGKETWKDFEELVRNLNTRKPPILQVPISSSPFELRQFLT